MNEIMPYIFIYMIYLLLGGMMAVTPYITRKTESFGVSIPEKMYSQAELVTLRRNYVRDVLMLTVVVVVGMLYLSRDLTEKAISILQPMGIFVFIGILFIIYLKYHFQMKKLKEEQGWYKELPQKTVVDMGFRNQKLTYSNWWFLIPLAITIATFFMGVGYYELIPDQIPMQYDFSGEVSRYAEKSYKTVFLPTIIQVMMLGIFIFMNIVIARARQQTNASNPERSIHQNILFRRRWSAFTIIGSVAMVLLFTFMQLSMIIRFESSTLMYVILGFTLFIVIGSLALAINTGQGGSRIEVKTGSEKQILDRDEDKYWKLGQFYYNPEDSALFIEKRFGVGWTLNWARSGAWLAMGILIVSMVSLIIFIK